jgi:hypothetical protein
MMKVSSLKFQVSIGLLLFIVAAALPFAPVRAACDCYCLEVDKGGVPLDKEPTLKGQVKDTDECAKKCGTSEKVANCTEKTPPASAAQGASTSKPVAQWTDGECRGVGGFFVPPGDCYSSTPAPTALSVNIGSLSSATITTYIQAIYNYLLGAAAVLAVIVIAVGGFRYIIAAGGAQIEEAKKMIVHAIVGLLIAVTSYVLLQTVNPQLTVLRLPPIKLVRADYLDQIQPVSMEGQACWTISDKAKCEASCPGCTCYVVQDSPLANALETFGTIISIPISFIGGGGIIAGKAALQATGFTIKGGVKIIYALGKSLTPGAALPVVGKVIGAVGGGAAVAGVASTAAAYAGLAYWDSASAHEGEKGVCIAVANHSVPRGDWCENDNNCQIGLRCVTLDHNIPLRACSKSDDGSLCNDESPCAEGLKCLHRSGFIFPGNGICSIGNEGSVCDENLNCNSGHCSHFRNGGDICTDGALPKELGTYSPCVVDGDCYTGQVSVETAKWRCVKFPGKTLGQCGDKGDTSPCLSNDDCSKGYTCGGAGEGSYGACMTP